MHLPFRFLHCKHMCVACCSLTWKLTCESIHKLTHQAMSYSSVNNLLELKTEGEHALSLNMVCGKKWNCPNLTSGNFWPVEMCQPHRSQSFLLPLSRRKSANFSPPSGTNDWTNYRYWFFAYYIWLSKVTLQKIKWRIAKSLCWVDPFKVINLCLHLPVTKSRIPPWTWPG